jgi:hypothetical protein
VPLLSLAAYWIGQANDNSGSTHPTGYAAGQRWSTTSSQWQAMYTAEVALYTAMVADRDTWQSRANNAWGSSRVWNTGTSWESAYNSEVTAYTDMVNQRNIWSGRADSAWGASRTWSSGESWEAAYARVLPPGDGTATVAASGSASSSGEVCRVTLNRTGYWAIVFRGTASQGANAAPASISTNVGDSAGWDAGGDQSMSSGIGLQVFSVWSVGTIITVNFNDGGGGNSVSGTLTAFFVASQSYPH